MSTYKLLLLIFMFLFLMVFSIKTSIDMLELNKQEEKYTKSCYFVNTHDGNEKSYKIIENETYILGDIFIILS